MSVAKRTPSVDQALSASKNAQVQREVSTKGSPTGSFTLRWKLDVNSWSHWAFYYDKHSQYVVATTLFLILWMELPLIPPWFGIEDSAAVRFFYILQITHLDLFGRSLALLVSGVGHRTMSLVITVGVGDTWYHPNYQILPPTQPPKFPGWTKISPQVTKMRSSDVTFRVSPSKV